MNLPTIQLLAFFTILLSTCFAMAEEPVPTFRDSSTITFGDSSECVPERQDGDSEETIPSWLRPGELAFVRAEEGQAVPLNSIIVMPERPDDEEALLIIEFSRRDLHEAFVQAFFFDRQALIPVVHPYAQTGVEYLLTEERLILKIHPDVIFHLRDEPAWPGGYEMSGEPGFWARMFTNSDVYEIFKSDDVIGKVILVSGEVFVSADPEFAKANFDGVYTQLRNQLAHFTVITLGCMQSSLNVVTAPTRRWPESYPPRVLPGR